MPAGRVYYIDTVVGSSDTGVQNVAADHWRCLRLERSSLSGTAALCYANTDGLSRKNSTASDLPSISSQRNIFFVRRRLKTLAMSELNCTELGCERVQCRIYLDPEDIFKCEVEETHDKLLLALTGLETFKKTYEDHRRRLSEYRSNSSSGASLEDWEFPPQIIFHRYDRYLARLASIKVCICICLVILTGRI